MADLANERVAYINGRILPESQVMVSFRDRGFKLGDAVFDVCRTFGGKPFKLKEHVERLYRSLRYLRIDPGLSPDALTAVSEDVLERNRHLLGPDDDYWLAQRVSRGVDVVGGELWESQGATVIVECTPLPQTPRARFFRDGLEVITPAVRRAAPDALSPNAKTHNYLNLVVADLQARAHKTDGWPILLDHRGFLCEGNGSNIFLVRDGALLTPKSQYVLAGVSRQTVMDLAGNLGIPVLEEDLMLQDAANADEAFVTSTSFCLCPVASYDGQSLGDGSIPGPITERLTRAFTELVDFDFVAQYLRHLN